MVAFLKICQFGVSDETSISTQIIWFVTGIHLNVNC